MNKDVLKLGVKERKKNIIKVNNYKKKKKFRDFKILNMFDLKTLNLLIIKIKIIIIII